MKETDAAAPVEAVAAGEERGTYWEAGVSALRQVYSSSSSSSLYSDSGSGSGIVAR